MTSDDELLDTHADRVHVVEHPLVQHKLSVMRSVDTPPALFRRVMAEMGTLLGYEAMRTLPTIEETVTTPLGPALGSRLVPDPVLVSVLRAGNGLLAGMLDVVPTAAVGFIGLERDHETLEAIGYYEKLPSLEGRSVVVVDPMLATGNSAVAALERIRAAGAEPMTFVALVASAVGVRAVLDATENMRVVTAAIDGELDHRGYIVPGLGDAGDRTFGT